MLLGYLLFSNIISNKLAKPKMTNIFSTIKNTIRDQDVFAIPVLMTYKGRTAFTTVLGGCMTILLVLFLLMYFIYELRQQL